MACSLTIYLALILLQSTKVQIQRAAEADKSKSELDLIHELSSPSAASREALNVLGVLHCVAVCCGDLDLIHELNEPSAASGKRSMF